MLLRCCVLILILSHKISCDSGVEPEMKNNSISTTANNSSTFSKSSREFKNESLLDMKIYTSNKPDERSFRGRFVEQYHVTTSDDYILTIFRMTYDNNEPPPKKRPVLLVHGMYQSSDQFLQQIVDQNLALKLQNLGYDVWLANFRGNQYGRGHVSLDPDSDDKLKFFDYSYEELGVYDIASTVDFVLNTTTYEKLFYIGHSLGGTAFLVLNSLKPQYNSKFVTAYLMAPLGCQHYFPNDALKAELDNLDGLYQALLIEGSVEIFPFTDKHVKFSAADCLGKWKYQKICNELNIQRFMALKYVNNDISETRGGSIKQLVHLAQNVKSKTFSRWDYGKYENMKQYGMFTPPEYNLDLITVPTNLIYTPNDEFVSPEDIADMAREMINAKTTKVGRSNFTHADFVFASDVMETVYADIIKEMEEIPSIYEKDSGNNRNKRSFKPFLRWFLIPFSIIALIALIVLIWCVCCRQTDTDHDKPSVEPSNPTSTIIPVQSTPNGEDRGRYVTGGQCRRFSNRCNNAPGVLGVR